MTFSRTFPRRLLCVLVSVFAWTTVAHIQNTSANPPLTTIIYSGDVDAEIEPCGCRADPLGGMTRKAGLLKELASKSKTRFLLLDAGNLLFASSSIAPALVPQAKLQARTLIKSYNLLNHDAFVPGPNDFALGVKEFQKLKFLARFKFLGANLLFADGKPFLDPFRIFQFGNGLQKTRVAVLGLVGDQYTWPKELKVTSPLTSALEWVPKLRKQADIVILLTHLGPQGDRVLAEKVAGIDFIIGSGGETIQEEPETVSNVALFRTFIRNQFVGVIHLQNPFSPTQQKLIALEPKYEVQGTMSQWISRYKKQLRGLETTEKARATRNDLKTTPIPLYQTLPKCAECHIKQFEFWRATAHATALTALNKKHSLRNKECLSCHTLALGEANGFSSPSKMAISESGQSISVEALERFLVNVHDSKNLDETLPATSAISLNPSPQEEEEFTTLKRQLLSLKTSWAPVQCEHCHGPGRDHPFGSSVIRETSTQTCLTCHTPTRATGWYVSGSTKPNTARIEEKLKLVRCPTGQ